MGKLTTIIMTQSEAKKVKRFLGLIGCSVALHEKDALGRAHNKQEQEGFDIITKLLGHV